MNNIIADYIWIDHQGEIRCKTKILANDNYSVSNLPQWSFNGIHTKQSTEQSPFLVLKPVQMYANPFYALTVKAYIVLCEVYTQDDKGALRAHPDNSRSKFNEEAVQIEHMKPIYELTQEYYLIVDKGSGSLKHYAGVHPAIQHRNIANLHLQYCITAGINISAVFPEAGPNQWAFSIGPLEGIDALDQLITARYILYRITENTGLQLSFHPARLGEGEKGSGCYIMYSNLKTRYPGGYDAIMRIIEKLKTEHKAFISLCGDDTIKRLTGENDSSNHLNFAYGVDTTNVSIRIPRDTMINKRGSFEDRRPSANVDPYKVGLALYLASL